MWVEYTYCQGAKSECLHSKFNKLDRSSVEESKSCSWYHTVVNSINFAARRVITEDIMDHDNDDTMWERNNNLQEITYIHVRNRETLVTGFYSTAFFMLLHLVGLTATFFGIHPWPLKNQKTVATAPVVKTQQENFLLSEPCAIFLFWLVDSTPGRRTRNYELVWFLMLWMFWHYYLMASFLFH